MKQRRAPLLAMGAAMLSLVVAACSSSSKPSSNGTPTSAAAQAGTHASGLPIKVGLMCSCSGAFGSQLVPNADTFKAWADNENSAGGLNGHQIDVISEDDAATPGTSISEVQSLLSQHVDAIVDVSLADQAWASTVEAAGVPVVGGDLSNLAFSSNPDFYPSGQTSDSVTYANVATAKASGASKLGVLYCAEAASCAESLPLIKTAAKQLGLNVAYSAAISATAPNYTAQCLAAQQAHVQALVILDVSSVIDNVGGDCSRQGFNPAYVVEGGGFSNVIATSPGLKNNTWAEFQIRPYFDHTSAVAAMISAVQKYFPGLPQNTTLFSGGAVAGWPSGLLLADAVKAGGLTSGEAPSAAEVVKGLESLHGDTLSGWSPPLTFAAGKPHPVDCWITTRVQNAVPTVVGNGQFTCEKAAQ